MKSLFLWLLRRDWLVIAGFVLGSLFFLSCVQQLQIRTDNEIFLNKTGQNYQTYRKYVDQFGTDRVLLIALQDLSNHPSAQDQVSALKDYLTSLDGVDSVQLLGGAQKALAVRLHVDVGEKQRNILMKDIEKHMNRGQGSLVKGLLAGVPYFEYLFFLNIQKDQKSLVPLVFLVLCGLCFLFFQSGLAIAMALISIVLTLLWSMGTLAYFGKAINPLTSLLPPVVMVISLAHVVHILGFIAKKNQTNEVLDAQVLWQLVRTVGVPAFFAALTTCIGFFSLLVSHNLAIIEFGQFAGISSLYSFVISFVVALLGLKHCPQLAQKIRVRMTMSWLGDLYRFLSKLRFLWIGLALMAIVQGSRGMALLETDSTLQRFFKKNDPVHDSVDVLDRDFGGASSLEVVVRMDKPVWEQPKVMKQLVQFAAKLQQKEEVALMPSVEQVQTAMKGFLTQEDKLFFQQMISKDGLAVHWHVAKAKASTNEIRDLAATIQTEFEAMSFKGMSMDVTGRDLLFADMSFDLIQGQLQSLLMAACLIGLCLLLTLRSLYLGLLGIIAVVMPLSLTYGLMGYWHIPLNTATVMISSMAMGLLVDDTIHFLYSYQHLGRVEDALAMTGRAILITSLILIVGFSAGLAGRILPTIQFSGLMSLVSGLGLLANLGVLPLMLPRSGKKG